MEHDGRTTRYTRTDVSARRWDIFIGGRSDGRLIVLNRTYRGTNDCKVNGVVPSDVCSSNM